VLLSTHTEGYPSRVHSPFQQEDFLNPKFFPIPKPVWNLSFAGGLLGLSNPGMPAHIWKYCLIKTWKTPIMLQTPLTTSSSITLCKSDASKLQLEQVILNEK